MMATERGSSAALRRVMIGSLTCPVIFEGRYLPQYDFGKPSTFSAMKLRISCGLIGAMRGISDSRR